MSTTSLSTDLRREFIKLLESDVEFRYTVAGYLGLSEILRSIERLWEEIKALREGQNKLWEEVRGLREEVRRLWENQNKLWENQNRLWEEVKALREGQNKLWENQNRLWEEVRSLREETKKLWEGQNKLWEEVRALREGQNKLWENQNKLWENQNRLWEEVKSLREGQNKLWDAYIRLDRYVRSGFRDLRRVLGSTFESFAAAFVEVMLEDMGYVGVEVGRKVLVVDNEVLEINLFSEKPLVVGELTMHIGTVEEARREVEKLLKRVRAVEKLYGVKPVLIILCVAKVSPEALTTLRTLTKESGIKLITKEDIEEEVGSI
ncbi:MAG: hypothetical protein QXH99_08025 [Sulfolobales archaeon]